MEKLYETYEQEQDPFLQEVSLYLSETEIQEYYRKNLDFSDNRLLETEKWLTRAFQSKWLTRGRDLGEQVSVALLLLCVPYITSRSLYELNLFDTTKQASSWLSYNVFSTRNKKGFLRSFSTKHSNVRKAYTLTAAARENLLEALPQKYIDVSLGTSDSSITKTNCHDAFCCHLYYWLLADYSFPYFDWYSTPYFDDNFTFSENMDKITKKAMLAPKNSSGFRPDALLKTLQHKAHYFFVEQDMCTEKPIRIQEKFKRYSKLLATIPSKEIPFVSIIFSIYTDTTDVSLLNPAELKKVDKTATVSSVKRNCDDLQVYIKTLSSIQEHITLADIMDKLLQNMRTAENKKLLNRFNRMYTLLEDFQQKYQGKGSLKELQEYMENVLKKTKEDKKKEKQMQEHLSFLSRKKSIINTVSEISDLCSLFQKGLRFVQVKTFLPEELKFVYLYEHRKEILEETLLPMLMKKFPLANNYSIHNYISFGNELLFPNHVYFEQNKSHIIFENISIDLSSKFRLKKFLQNTTALSMDFLYIVLLVSEINDALEFNKNILENGETVASRYSDPDDVRSPLANIQIVYICYKKIRKMPRFTPFTLDKNNTILEL